jgi:hypothetical protein
LLLKIVSEWLKKYFMNLLSVMIKYNEFKKITTNGLHISLFYSLFSFKICCTLIRCFLLKFVVLYSLFSFKICCTLQYLRQLERCFGNGAQRISRKLSIFSRQNFFRAKIFASTGVSGNRTSFPKQQILALAKVLTLFVVFF